MGDIKRYKSACGYECRIQEGAGLRAIDPETAYRFFPDRADLISEGLASGQIRGTVVYTRPGVCDACKKIVPVSLLHIEYAGGGNETVTGACPGCAGAVRIFEEDEPVICPICGKEMEAQIAGFWD